MVALIIAGIVVLVLFLLAMLSASLYIGYNGAFLLSVRILFIRLRLYPKGKKRPLLFLYSPRLYRKKLAKIKKKKADRERKKILKNKKKQKAAVHAGNEKDAQKEKKDIRNYLPLIGKLVAALGKLCGRRLRIKAVKAVITVGSEDAATTAMLYGGITQSLSYLIALLDRNTSFAYDKKNITVTADFTADKITADILLVLRVRVWHLVALAFSLAFAYVKNKQTGQNGNKNIITEKITEDNKNG